MSTASGILDAAVAGSWYPARRDELAGLVDRLLDDARARGPAAAGARAVVAPHAGFAYSGAVAASAFGTISETSPSRVILLGPSHYFGFPGAAIPKNAGAQRTPLGEVPFDREALAALADADGFTADDRFFVPEHALEAEIPFLQRLLGRDVPIVPILLGGDEAAGGPDGIAKAIAPLADRDALIVVSSDFTHYGPRFGYVPFVEEIPERLRALDLGAAEAIARGDAEGFARHVASTGATICGRRAIDVLLRLPRFTEGGRVVEYDTSGRMTGSWDHSVSYASLAFVP